MQRIVGNIGWEDRSHQRSTTSVTLLPEEDFDLLRICDEPDGVVEAVQSWYIKHEIGGRKALARYWPPDA